jgi:hypothetical protein
VQSLESLALKSETIAQELLETLTALHVNVKGSRYKSFVQAVGSIWSSRKIEKTQRRLDRMRTALLFHIQVRSREDILRSLDDLDDVSRQVLVAVLQSKDEIVRQQQASEALAMKRHEQLVNTVSNYRSLPISQDDVLDEIKARLHDQIQDDRFEDIAEAHQSTFQWILKHDNNTQSTWPNLYHWLQNDQGLYWISGKAGSGKSTLMKFLRQEPRLQEALHVWAGDRKLLILSFYFWNAGSDLQRTQEGLFRSLLFQALEQESPLAKVLFPEQHVRGCRWTESFTFQEIRRAFRRFITQLDSSLAVAMLIDGLDEFDATDLTMTELGELFATATRSSNIKALLSSRPLAPFEFSFESVPKLRLHQLTREDITTYVHDKFTVHPRVTTLMEDHAGAI